MIKFEYLVMSRPSQDKLASLGDNGWELVAVDSNVARGYYFKRVIRKVIYE